MQKGIIVVLQLSLSSPFPFYTVLPALILTAQAPVPAPVLPGVARYRPVAGSKKQLHISQAFLHTSWYVYDLPAHHRWMDNDEYPYQGYFCRMHSSKIVY